jgi:hypothetical protein
MLLESEKDPAAVFSSPVSLLSLAVGFGGPPQRGVNASVTISPAMGPSAIRVMKILRARGARQLDRVGQGKP